MIGGFAPLMSKNSENKSIEEVIADAIDEVAKNSGLFQFKVVIQLPNKKTMVRVLIVPEFMNGESMDIYQ